MTSNYITIFFQYFFFAFFQGSEFSDETEFVVVQKVFLDNANDFFNTIHFGAHLTKSIYITPPKK